MNYCNKMKSTDTKYSTLVNRVSKINFKLLKNHRQFSSFHTSRVKFVIVILGDLDFQTIKLETNFRNLTDSDLEINLSR